MVNPKNYFSQPTKGFTLIELLVVIAILAVLMSVVVITINPAEMLKKSRDSRRVSDLDALRTALNLYLSEDKDFTSLDNTKAYLSLSGSPCTVASYGGKTATQCVADPRKVDGNGWIPLNFTSLSIRSPLSSLPVDPTNSNPYFYAFTVSSTKTMYELNAKLEANSNSGLMSSDGGNSATVYEIGSDLTLFN
ncbi:MAG: type II secretion system protein [Candidatus Paceibacterota bacterium]|jgi:prepilin-type N-terminal cleavage/methylation domain-containing protein|nr:type II secretion system protein [Candidatus Paceibacterota bacterium]HPD55362.1 type II secretion system protein [Candidatus Paceibacterota bacterium]HQM34834.1 type II secretion system protein [Candidatus Paceibacterota bacterium]HQQ38632.1 type II secretion system protein [bacterium]